MRRIAYIDGFNLYYGALKHRSSLKWVNLQDLCNIVLPDSNLHPVSKTKYFIARVNARPGDRTQPDRQKIFLTALGTIPDFEIIYGQFQRNEVKKPLSQLVINNKKLPGKTAKDIGLLVPIRTFPGRRAQTLEDLVGQEIKSVMVWEEKEKGSDVNLASHLLMDAYENKFDEAVVITNDSDLFAPINIVSKKLKKKVHLIYPSAQYKSQKLRIAVRKRYTITEDHLKQCQFPNPILRPGKPALYKPTEWT